MDSCEQCRQQLNRAAALREPPDFEKQKEQLRGRIPLVIGVTGHRDLHEGDEPKLKTEVARAIKRLKKDYLDDDPDTPIILLSALAEGADSLVADVALDEGVILIAPLPMESDEYLEDFRPSEKNKPMRPDAEARFKSLRNCALGTVEIPYRKGSSRQLVHTNQDKRDEQYEEVGLYIVNHCHVLIALWNGAEGPVGGTSRIVEFKRHGIPYDLSKNARIALDGSEIGPVIEIGTPRTKPGSPQVKIETKEWGFDLTGAPLRGIRRWMRDTEDFIGILFGKHPEAHQVDPFIRAWNVFRVTVDQTRRFNLESTSLAASAGGEGKLKKSLTGLFTDYADAGAEARRVDRAPIHLPAEGTSSIFMRAAHDDALSIAARWCETYQRADALALSWQEQFKRDWFWLFAAAFIAIILFEIYAHLYGFSLLLVLYIVSLGIGFYLFIRARVKQHQEQFLDCRALAEAVRVGIFWKLARIARRDPTADGRVSEAYPIKQPSELAWVKIAARTYDLLDDALKAPLLPASRGTLDTVRSLWVVGQWAYFTGKSRTLSLNAERREGWSLVVLGFSPVVGAVGLAIYLLCIRDHEVWEHWRHYMIVAMGLLVGLGAVIAGHTEQLAFKAQGRQYERMSLLFEKALLLVNKILKATPITLGPVEIEQIQRLYVELGAEAMKEHAEWVAIYRQRPIRPAG